MFGFFAPPHASPITTRRELAMDSVTNPVS